MDENATETPELETLWRCCDALERHAQALKQANLELERPARAGDRGALEGCSPARARILVLTVHASRPRALFDRSATQPAAAAVR